MSKPRSNKGQRPETRRKYREAVEFYRTTDLTIGRISEQCGIGRSALASYLRRHHRDLLLQRHGAPDSPDNYDRKLHDNKGQRPETREKYRDAILACDSEEYLHLSISEIARMFHLNPTALANQLRAHYPDILPRREAERHRRNLSGNSRHGVSRQSALDYAKAVELLRTSNLTIQQAARECGVSFSGLRQHIIFYHQGLTALREGKRLSGKHKPVIGRVSGNGQVRQPSPDIAAKYAGGVELYRTTSLPVTEIARRIGVNVNTFRNHLATWHRRLMFERRNSTLPSGTSDREPLGNTKRYSKSTAGKYADAITELKDTGASVESVSKKYGFTPEVFRAYLKEHEPGLYDTMGMMTLPNGRLVLKRSYERYREAIEAYTTGDETLKAIATRLGIPYNSLTAFIRRNLVTRPGSDHK